MNYKILKRNELFKKLDDKQIEIILSKFIVEEFQKNSTIFNEGDTINNIYLIIEGNIEIAKYDINGNKSIVNILSEYEMFAESIALSNNNIAVYTTTAITNVKLLSIHVLAFKELLYLNKQLIFNFLELLANKNSYLTFKSNVLAKKTIREKVIEVLKHHYYLCQSNKIKLPFNKSKLADFIGVNRSALERELSKMIEDNIITYQDKTFTINIKYIT